jgi:CrcB protein
MWRNAIWVAMASGAGGALRYLAGRWVQPSAGNGFPLATLLVNLLGCLLIGIFSGLSARQGGLSPQTSLLLTTGFCGGFTTFSAFAWENVQMLRSGNAMNAILYIIASLALGLAAAWAGLLLTKAS